MQWTSVFALGVSIAGVLIIPGIVGLVALIRRVDKLTAAVEGVTAAVKETHEGLKETNEDLRDLRKDHAALGDRVTHLEAGRARD